MIIILENELVHTDSFSDVIEHHGVKGMKWGRRIGRAVKNAGIIYANSYIHPTLTESSKYRTERQYREDKKKYRSDKKDLKRKFADKQNKIMSSNGDINKITKMKDKNSSDRKAALRKLKENYKKYNSWDGLLERQVQNLNNNKAAKLRYKQELMSAKDKGSRKVARQRYRKAIDHRNN